MKILFIAPRFPLPADTGGKIRTLNILKQLAKRAKVHLVCFSFDEDDKDRSPDIEKEGVEVTLVPFGGPGILRKIAGVLFRPQPFSAAKYYSENMEVILRELNETNRFDAVHIDHIHMAHYIDCFAGVPCVIDEHNVEYKILERCANVEKSFIKRLVFRNQAAKMKRFEAAMIKKAARYLAVSEDDKMLLVESGAEPEKGHVVPNGVDTEYFKSTGAQEQRHPERAQRVKDLNNLDSSTPSVLRRGVRMTAGEDQGGEEEAVVFTGSMDWLPNDDAALYFCKEILPLIWQTDPSVKFYIVGKGASAALTECAKRDQRIVLTGRVDDVRVFVERSKVFVVPLRIGGGTRLKILEALSMGKAVVSTTIGAEGISHQNGHNIILADEPEVFAQNVLRLLKDDERRQWLGKAGRELVLGKYDWNIVGSRLGEIYETIRVA